MRRLLPLLWLLIPLLPLVLQAGSVAFSPGSAYTDLLVSHYPNALWIQRSIQSGRGIPWWSPGILSGYPLTANPLSGLHYPPGWLALLLPLPLGLNLLMIAHLLWGGSGLYLFLRREGLDPRAALLGGLCLAALPRLYAHFAAGHVTLLYAVSWLPWLLAAELGSGGGRLRLWPGLLLGLCVLADPRIGVYAGVLWSGWKFSTWRRNPAGDWRGLLTSYGANVTCAALVAAPLLLPMGQYVLRSTRSAMTAADTLLYSLPPAQLLGLVYPNPTISSEWVWYGGASATSWITIMALRGSLRARARFWVGILLFSILFALGEYFAPARWASALPGFSLLRVPPRALLLAGLALAVLIAYALDGYLRGRSAAERRSKFARLALAAVSALVVFFGVGGAVLAAQARFALLWGAGFWLAGLALYAASGQGRLRQGTAAALLTGLCLLDWMGVNLHLVEFRGLYSVFAGHQALVQQLDPSLTGRVYSPSYSLPQHAAAQAGLELADGVDPLQLAAYSEFFARASGVPLENYSVTLPAFASGDPRHDNAAYRPNAELLGWLAVNRVVSAYPLQGDLLLRNQIGDTYLYDNPNARPLAWIQTGGTQVAEQWSAVRILARHPNQIALSVTGPGLVVLSEIAYPGWNVSIDHRGAQPVVVSGLLRGVNVTEGTHTIKWVFRPWLFFAGWALFVLGIALVVIFGLRERHDR